MNIGKPALAFYRTYLELLDQALHEKCKFTDILASIEANTGIKRVHLAQVLIGVVCLCMFVRHVAALICNAIGFLYPAYASVRAIESPTKQDDTQWLTYWVVFAAFSVLEFFSDIIFFWFPFYWLAKIVFLVWCFLPLQNNGSTVIYSRIIRPFFLRNEHKIDAVLHRATHQVSSLIGDKASDSESDQSSDSNCKLKRKPKSDDKSQ